MFLYHPSPNSRRAYAISEWSEDRPERSQASKVEGTRRWTNSNEPDTSGPEISEPDTNEPDTSGSETHVPLTSVAKVSVERLKLDGLNPRLFAIGDEPSDIDIISELYRSEDLNELLQSIAANGYLDIEPLIVLEEHGYLTVLEGNRRLAAIRLFETPALVNQILERTRVRITVPTLPERLRDTIREVSVYRVNSRKDARSFIGFKHINGAAKWGSYAKARFAANWHRSGEVTLEEIAAQIGDNHDTIKRMVNGIYVLEQAGKSRCIPPIRQSSLQVQFFTSFTRPYHAPHICAS